MFLKVKSKSFKSLFFKRKITWIVVSKSQRALFSYTEYFGFHRAEVSESLGAFPLMARTLHKQMNNLKSPVGTGRVWSMELTHPWPLPCHGICEWNANSLQVAKKRKEKERWPLWASVNKASFPQPPDPLAHLHNGKTLQMQQSDFPYNLYIYQYTRL